MCYNGDMEIILSHNMLDCDGLASLIAMSRLRPQARPVLLGSLNRNVRELVEMHGERLRLARLRDLPRGPITRLILVDTQTPPSDEALLRRLQESNPAIEIYDHHPLSADRPRGAAITHADTGATTTILVELMQQQGCRLSPDDASLLILGIYEDTGNLTYATTTPRDARAAAWLLEQGASLKLVTDYIDRPLSQRQWRVYEELQAGLIIEQISGYTVLLAAARAEDYVEELSTLAHKLTDDYDPDASFVLVQMEDVVQVIARSRHPAIDVAAILKPLGGGGHAPAAAALVRGRDIDAVRAELWQALRQGLAPVVTAADIMSPPTHTVKAGATIAEAQRLLRRYGHDALPILSDGGLSGLIMRRDAEKAMHYGLGERPVESFATFDMPTITPRTPFIEMQDLLHRSNSGHLPVLDGERLVGIVTRTDIIRRWSAPGGALSLGDRLRTALPADVLSLLTLAGNTASHMGASLFLVGGFVRDLLLGLPNYDLDLVVEGDAIALAQRLAATYGGRTISHARFGTAKWLVTPDQRQLHLTRPLTLDLVTARTEFYDRPAALPQVEASSLRHDLYRRDFTINTMAICLNANRFGELIDYYGGKADLDRRLIRVLHNLSFVDDATRILRAARLAERLAFDIEARTVALIADAGEAINRLTADRLRHEFYLALREAAPERIILRLHDLGVLRHIHPAVRHSAWLDDRYAALRAALPAWRAWGWGNGGRGGDETTALTAAYVALLAYHLSADEFAQLTQRLNLAGTIRAIVENAWALRRHAPALTAGCKPSQIYHLLHAFMVEAIVIVDTAEDAPLLHQAIALFMQTLRHMRPEIDGNTLRDHAVPPGPLYSRVLQAVLDARLDGVVTTRAEEEQLALSLLAAAQD